MNHLFSASEGVRRHPDIEYLCSDHFSLTDEVSFHDYPQQQRYNYDTPSLIQAMDLSPLEEWEADAFLQEWLFFILLADVFRVVGVGVVLDDFVVPGESRFRDREEPGRKVVTMKELQRYLETWYTRERRCLLVDDDEEEDAPTTRDQCRTRAVKIFDLLRSATTAYSNLQWHSNRYTPIGPFGLSVVCLMETLHHAAHAIYSTALSEQERAEMTLSWPSSPWLPRRMERDGWCPNHVRRLQHLLSNSGLYFASSLQFSGDTASDFNHSSCKELECNVNLLDRDTYRPVHRCASGDCPHLGPDQEEVERLLVAGKVPVLRVVDSTTVGGCGAVQLEVVSSDQTTYTAVSHVWSDGRGNLVTNTLPSCQVLHVVSLIRDSLAGEETCFWMDTLCCPVKGPLRRVAISMMRKTYEEAAQVLVLDKALEDASCQVDPEEVLIRITCSGWMRRLWTLQEGILARRLLFQFREHCIDLEAMRKAVEGAVDRALRSPVSSDVVACCYNFQGFKTVRPSEVLDLVRAAQWRTTSWAQDETICLSILLDLDVGKIEATEPETRMSTFLEMLGSFPFELAFLPGPRLQQKNYRWAPRSLIPAKGHNLPPTYTIASQRPRGLFVKAPGIKLQSLQKGSDIVWVRLGKASSAYIVRNLSERDDGGASWKDRPLDTLDEPVIICVGHIRSMGLDADAGLLVNVTFSSQEVTVCDMVSRVHIARDTHNVLQQMVKRHVGDAAPEAAFSKSGMAEWIDEQVWCIQ